MGDVRANKGDDEKLREALAEAADGASTTRPPADGASANKSEAPAAQPEAPAAKSEASAAAVAPAAQPEVTAAAAVAPAAQPEVPAAKPEAPAARPEAPTMQSKASVTNSVADVASATRPAAQPATQPGTSATRPAAQPATPAAHHEKSPAPPRTRAERNAFAHAPSIAEQVALVPTDPGCYLWKDAKGEVLYVGKAKNLRARMRQYVQLTDERPMVPRLMAATASFDYVVVGSEHEALVLEINLIHQYRPPFNVDLRDDKSYPYIALTKGDLFPAIKYTRERHRPDTRYFGPYTDARAARATIDVVRKVMPLCVATCAEWKRVRRQIAAHPEQTDVVALAQAENGRPCFDYHVGRGPGVCAGCVTPEEYAGHVAQVERFLSGHRGEFVGQLKAEMAEAAANLDFERAGRVKRRLAVIDGLDDKQRVVLSSAQDVDVVGFWREETIAGACVFVVREGRVTRTCEFVLDKGLDVGEEELVSGFVKRYYDQTSDIPLEVCVPVALADAETLEGWLTARRGRKVELHVPQRGQKAAIAKMATNNAHHYLARYELRTGYEDKRTNEALLQLESALALDEPPMRIECFDISTIHGKHTVASMVVFTGGKPDKGQYRRFKIRADLDEANDFVSMSEVLARRYGPERMADERFGKRPDLLILDGGKPQLTAAIEQLGALGVDIPMAGLAKSDEELFVPWDDMPVVLPSGSASLYLVKRVRDEAHRFAITFHRELRDKAMTVSILDEIPGVGEKRKRALRRAFGSMRRLREASEDQIAAVPGIPVEVAHEIWGTLRAWDEELGRGREAALGEGAGADDAVDAGGDDAVDAGGGLA